MKTREELAKELFSHYPNSTIKAFSRFHKENPQVYEEFKTLSFKMKKTGRKRYSSKMLINVLRWNFDLMTTGDEFKINDRYQSLYGRLLIMNHPEFDGFFELRIRSKV